MNDVTRLLHDIDQGDRQAAVNLLPLVYKELRRLAEHKLSLERAGQTLQATALVHEAYLRLVGAETGRSWESRGHFFAAAAQAMRRILIDNARRKRAEKHGGRLRRVELTDVPTTLDQVDLQLLALDAALTRFATEDPLAARIVELRYFAGLSIDDAADALGLSRATAYRQWKYARAWLRDAISGDESG